MKTVDEIVHACRVLGMTEYTSLSTFEFDVPAAKWLRASSERHAQQFFYDAKRKITVLPAQATLASPQTGVIAFWANTTTRTGVARLGGWLAKHYRRELDSLSKTHTIPNY